MSLPVYLDRLSDEVFHMQRTGRCWVEGCAGTVFESTVVSRHWVTTVFECTVLGEEAMAWAAAHPEANLTQGCGGRWQIDDD